MKKPSILTSAMQMVAAKKAGEDGENITPETEEVRGKRALKKYGAVVLGTLVTVVVVNYLTNRDRDDETSEETETPTED